MIGPNGAGKTTLFNLITGVYKPTHGEIRLDGESIGGKSPDELARRGVARTFQNLQICMNMSAIENVMVGAHPVSYTHLDVYKRQCSRRAARSTRFSAVWRSTIWQLS